MVNLRRLLLKRHETAQA
jgi:hypothetical protein